MPYDLTTAAGMVALIAFLVQPIKGTKLAAKVPIWAIALSVSALLALICKLVGLLPQNPLPLLFNVAVNAMAASGGFTWFTGQAGRRPPRPRKKRAD